MNIRVNLDEEEDGELSKLSFFHFEKKKYR